jgi:uncharacterized protein YbaP (TraB family)
MQSRPWLAACAALILLAAPRPGAARSLGDLEQGTLFVWEIVNPSDTDAHPDYLAGTIHLAMPKSKRLPEAALDRLSRSTCFVMEADIETLRPEVVMPFIFRQDKQSNQKHLSPGAWQRTVKQASTLGFKADQVARLEPWFLTTFLGVGPNDPNRSRDMLLRREAEELDLPVIYLEKAVDQLKMMRSLPDTYFYKQLEALDDATDKNDVLADAYELGDLPTLESTTFDHDDMQQFPQVYQRLFYDRNTRWMPALERVMRQHRAFVAVGLGHLIGDQGLLQDLARKGYRVSPVVMDLSAPTKGRITAPTAIPASR